jgi:NADH-quinone oxidoreductase subunit M
MLWMFQRVNYGEVTNPKNRGLRDLSPREWVVIAPICAMAIIMGVAPGWFLRPMEPAVRKTVQTIVGTNRPMNTLAAPTDSGPQPSRTDVTTGSVDTPVAPLEAHIVRNR